MESHSQNNNNPSNPLFYRSKTMSVQSNKKRLKRTLIVISSRVSPQETPSQYDQLVIEAVREFVRLFLNFQKDPSSPLFSHNILFVLANSSSFIPHPSKESRDWHTASQNLDKIMKHFANWKCDFMDMAHYSDMSKEIAQLMLSNRSMAYNSSYEFEIIHLILVGKQQNNIVGQQYSETSPEKRIKLSLETEYSVQNINQSILEALHRSIESIGIVNSISSAEVSTIEISIVKHNTSDSVTEDSHTGRTFEPSKNLPSSYRSAVLSIHALSLNRTLRSMATESLFVHAMTIEDIPVRKRNSLKETLSSFSLFVRSMPSHESIPTLFCRTIPRDLNPFVLPTMCRHLVASVDEFDETTQAVFLSLVQEDFPLALSQVSNNFQRGSEAPDINAMKVERPSHLLLRRENAIYLYCINPKPMRLNNSCLSYYNQTVEGLRVEPMRDLLRQNILRLPEDAETRRRFGRRVPSSISASSKPVSVSAQLSRSTKLFPLEEKDTVIFSQTISADLQLLLSPVIECFADASLVLKDDRLEATVQLLTRFYESCMHNELRIFPDIALPEVRREMFRRTWKELYNYGKTFYEGGAIQQNLLTYMEKLWPNGCELKSSATPTMNKSFSAPMDNQQTNYNSHDQNTTDSNNHSKHSTSNDSNKHVSEEELWNVVEAAKKEALTSQWLKSDKSQIDTSELKSEAELQKLLPIVSNEPINNNSIFGRYWSQNKRSALEFEGRT